MDLATRLRDTAAVMSNGTVVGPKMRREIFIFKWLWNALHNRPIVVEGGSLRWTQETGQVAK